MDVQAALNINVVLVHQAAVQAAAIYVEAATVIKAAAAIKALPHNRSILYGANIAFT
jgi:hypothetical protein